MITSSKLQEKIVEYLSDQGKHSVQEIKVFLSQNGIIEYTEGQFAGSINTLLRNGTIKKIDRGVYCIKARSEDMKKCFVICPIGEEGSDIRANSDKLFKYIISPVCDMCDFAPVRVDKQNDANSIPQTIIELLETSDLVIADITGHNPNVFYEMGYRARTKKPMIHLRKKGEGLPFDVNAIRTFDYDLTDLDSVEEIKDRLKKTIESFTYTDSVEDSEESDTISDNATPSIIPILYQILDTMGELKSEVKNFTSDTIGAVIKNMQPTQPQVSAETALQMQIMNSIMQNPDSIYTLLELSEKINTKNKKK